MITNYEIRKIDNEEVLFLYFDFDSEFSMDNIKEKYKDIEEYINKFIKDNKITFIGSSVVLVVGTSILGNILLNNSSNTEKYDTYVLKDGYQELISSIPSEDNLEELINTENNNTIKEDENDKINSATSIENNSNIVSNDIKNNDNVMYENINTSTNTINESANNNVNDIVNENTSNEDVIDSVEEIDNNTYITIQRSNGQMETIELEEYITGVVSSEMPTLFHTEALKAQAIIARTYALKAISKGRLLTDSNSTQNYKDINQLKNMWGGNFNTYYNKVKDAVNSTKGMYLTYDGTYIEAVYHSTSNGQTESSTYAWGNYYPYLISVASEYDYLNPSFLVNTTMSYEKLSSLLEMDINIDTTFNITDRTDGNRVRTIIVNDKSYSGTNFRNLLGLRSADFDVEKAEDGVVFTTRGYGHGVGMSQYGANGMAKNGYSYSEILNHYYPGTVINS